MGKAFWSVSLWALVSAGCATGGSGGLALGPSTPGNDGPPPRDSDGLSAIASEPPRAPLDLTDWARMSPSGSQVLQVLTEPGDIPHLELASDATKRLPLEQTRVRAWLTGFVAEVEVAQTYGNTFGEPIEAVYVFPLPENSAVNDMRMRIGEREIVAEIQERGEARRTYETAKAAGHTAALLEQERPNVFTQSVANVEPGKKIDVVVRYVQDLSYDAGQYEFVFPMVVGPRFMPGQPTDGPQSGTGTHADTTAVPDASRISPPIVGKGERSGHDISILVTADAALAVGAMEVPTHEVATRPTADGRTDIALVEKDSVPNRDFVLRYAAAGPEPRAVLFASPPGPAGGYFSLVVQPPNIDVDGLVGRRELIFVVDVSGSMSGTPLGMCRSAMRAALMQLRPVDTFNILTFSGATRMAFPSPRPANDANVRQALEVVSRLRAGGSTQMADAVQSALSTNVAAGRSRYVFFMTDGYVGNEAQIIATAEQFVKELEGRGQRARVFSFGVGSSTNRYLIDGLAKAGKGLGVYATTREDPARAVNRFFHYIDQPVLTGLRVEWGALGARELFPAELPDLFASHPVILHGQYTGNPGSTVTVAAKLGTRELTVPVQVRPAESKGLAVEVQGALWARSKVGALEELLWDGQVESVKQDIIHLGLSYRLVTPFTSFVAVDRSRVVGTGKPTTVVQPVEAPEGVDAEMAGGIRARKAPASPSAPGQWTFADDSYHAAKKAEQAAPARPAAEPTAGVAMASPPAPAAPPAGGGDEAAEEYREPDTGVYAAEHRRGCGCRVGGEHGGSIGGPALAMLGLLGARLRRRARGAARSARDIAVGPGAAMR